MFYKKTGTKPPVIRAGAVFEKIYTFGGNLFLKYATNNVPSETLEAITQEEFEQNMPVVENVPDTVGQSTEQEIIQAEIMLAQMEILEKQRQQDEVLAEILINQMGV